MPKTYSSRGGWNSKKGWKKLKILMTGKGRRGVGF